MLKIELEAALAVYEGINTPISLACYMLLKAGEFKQLVDKSVRPLDYLTPHEFADDYLCSSLLSKSKLLPTGIDCEQKAIERFHKAEEICRKTNARFEDPSGFSTRELYLIDRLQHAIQHILGPAPTGADLEYVEQHVRFGPGATTSITGQLSAGWKYANTSPELTPALVSYYHVLNPLGEHCERKLVKPTIVDGSKLRFVPKNAKTHRAICIEPDVNIWLQLSIGSLLRRKLEKIGLRLDSQFEFNRTLARLGSQDGSVATIDLSMASDTVAYSVVRTLLPPEWSRLLSLPRCDKTRYKDESIVLEKWSSMGNGYTFELETLIFSACCLVARRENSSKGPWSVFGDDICIPTDSVETVEELLALLGFELNAEKSFKTGPFRESCGEDFFLGVNVRPFFFREEKSERAVVRLQKVFNMANQVSAYSEKRYTFYRDVRLFACWRYLFQSVPKKDRLRVPKGHDGGFHSSFDESLPSISRSRFGHMQFQKWSFRPRKNPATWGTYHLCLHGRNPVDMQVSAVGEDARGSGSYILSKGQTYEWPYVGQWV